LMKPYPRALETGIRPPTFRNTPSPIDLPLTRPRRHQSCQNPGGGEKLVLTNKQQSARMFS
jgi:hypothetical protein